MKICFKCEEKQSKEIKVAFQQLQSIALYYSAYQIHIYEHTILLFNYEAVYLNSTKYMNSDWTVMKTSYMHISPQWPTKTAQHLYSPVSSVDNKSPAH